MIAGKRLQRLRTTEIASVSKAGVVAGQLRRTPEGVEFSYLPDYLEGGGPPVATTLPLSTDILRTSAGAVPPFFAGLLPEGRRLTNLRRAVKTSADDELTLLLAVGRDAVGDVQVLPAGLDDDLVEPLAQVESSWGEISFTDVLSEAGVVDPVALAGVQDKASARMISVPVERRGERFILKVDPPELRHVVENEAFFLRRASEAGLDVAVAEVVHDRDGRPGLLVRRFDRLAQPDGTTVMQACEDGCQVLGRWPADKYNVSAEEVVIALAEPCDARSVALRTLYQQLVYAWLTGNGDVHAKNLSILATSEGEWRVSPAYDLPSTVPYRDLTMALPMTGRTDGFGRHRLLDFAEAIGLPMKVAARALDTVLDRLAGMEDDLHTGALPFDGTTIDNLVKQLRYRRKQAQV